MCYIGINVWLCVSYVCEPVDHLWSLPRSKGMGTAWFRSESMSVKFVKMILVESVWNGHDENEIVKDNPNKPLQNFDGQKSPESRKLLEPGCLINVPTETNRQGSSWWALRAHPWPSHRNPSLHLCDQVVLWFLFFFWQEMDWVERNYEKLVIFT